MILVTCAIIKNSQKQVLVIQRSSEMHLPLKWEFPGGKIEAGETPEACLIPFSCTWLSGEIHLKEHSEYRWLDPTNLLDLN